MSNGKYKHSCCPHPPIFYANDKPSQLPLVYTSKPAHLFTPSSPNDTFSCQDEMRPQHSFQYISAAMRVVIRHESSVTQQLSSSSTSVKLKQAWGCLLASGCSSNLQEAVLWLEIRGLGHTISSRAPFALGSAHNQQPSRQGLHGTCQRRKEELPAATRPPAVVQSCFLEPQGELGLSNPSNRDSAAPFKQVSDVSRRRVLQGLQAL